MGPSYITAQDLIHIKLPVSERFVRNRFPGREGYPVQQKTAFKRHAAFSGHEANRTRPRCSSHDNGVSLARSNSDTVSGRDSSRIAA